MLDQVNPAAFVKLDLLSCAHLKSEQGSIIFHLSVEAFNAEEVAVTTEKVGKVDCFG